MSRNIFPNWRIIFLNLMHCSSFFSAVRKNCHMYVSSIKTILYTHDPDLIITSISHLFSPVFRSHLFTTSDRLFELYSWIFSYFAFGFLLLTSPVPELPVSPSPRYIITFSACPWLCLPDFLILDSLIEYYDLDYVSGEIILWIISWIFLFLQDHLSFIPETLNAPNMFPSVIMGCFLATIAFWRSGSRFL